MAFLNIDGVTYDVLTSGAEQAEPETIGKPHRAFSGAWRSQQRTRKRVWRFTLAPVMTQATLDALEAKTAIGAPLACVGDALPGGAVTCHVVITSAPYVPDGTAHRRGAALVLTEV